jgi:hypothetical protein
MLTRSASEPSSPSFFALVSTRISALRCTRAALCVIRVTSASRCPNSLIALGLRRRQASGGGNGHHQRQLHLFIPRGHPARSTA